MRSFLLALALLIFGWAAPATAAPTTHTSRSAHTQTTVRYAGYYYGASNPREIARIFRAAHAKDPTGRTMFDPNKCHRDGSCGAPLNLVESFQAHDPLGGWTLENAADKLDKLVLKCGFTGVYQMDRIILAAGSSFGRSDINGMSRTFNRDNERGCAWVNPETGRPVLAPNCTNPVGVRIDLDCVYHDVEAQDQSEFSIVWARYDRTDDECFAYRRVDRLFQADSPTAVWLTMPRGCIGHPCNMDADNAILGMEQLTQGQIPVSPGHYQVRVARNAFLVYCLKYRAAGGRVGSSFAVGVRWQQDYRLVGREWHARVYYESDDMLADGRQLNGPDGIAFYASHDDPEMERAMQEGRGR